MAYQIIWSKIIIVQYILLDFIGKKSLEIIDCLTEDGQQRYIELFGIKKFRQMAKYYNTDMLVFTSKDEIFIPNSLVHTLFENLNERARRLVAAFLVLSLKARKKVALANFLNLDYKTIQQGIKELQEKHILKKNRIRRIGGGRKPLSVHYPNLGKLLEEIAEDHIAGDPMNFKKWTRKSVTHFKRELELKGLHISSASIRKYFKKQKIRLRKIVKTISTQQHKDRDLQFRQISRLSKGFLKAGMPVISIDTKKKEQIGLFSRVGRAWRKIAKKAFDHDFADLGKGTLVPFGVYDLKHKEGHVYCNTSHETAEFLVDMIVKWWIEVGQILYPKKKKLLILCDAGGANGYLKWNWKIVLQERLVSKYGLQVTICHYPSGASKYNPIERKLFSFISMNWTGEILDTIETCLNFINSTRTSTGLSVKGYHIKKYYPTKIKYPKYLRDRLNIIHRMTLPDWNYTLFP